MKTVYINASPKKTFSASAYFLNVQRFFTGGGSEKYKLRTLSDGEKILRNIESCDAVVFVLPLYVDGVPSHVLYFLKSMEKYCIENELRITVYIFANNGFIEGCQNEPLMQAFENFCLRSGIKWGGGIGVGGGVMLNVMRIVFSVQVCLFLFSIIFSGVRTGNFLPSAAFLNFAEQAAVILFLNSGVFLYSAQMGFSIRKRGCFGKKYTRAMLPSFVFIVAANIFFFIFSVLEGGIFKGWLSRKSFNDENDILT